MPYMIWDKSLSIGHDAIDAEHRILLKCVNDLHDAMDERSDALIANVFDTLAQYTVNHFGREEELMQNTDYPDATHHANEHTLLVDILEEHRKKYFNGEEGKEEILHFLKLWLVGHIKGCDLKLGEHLKICQMTREAPKEGLAMEETAAGPKRHQEIEKIGGR